MGTEHAVSSVAQRGAETIARAFTAYQFEFIDITRRAPVRFAQRDWAARRQDALERLDLYAQRMAGTVRDLRAVLGPELKERRTWSAMRTGYSRLIAGRPDRELAQTFFNSATRQIFATVGVDPTIEYVDLHWDHQPPAAHNEECRSFPNGGNTARLVRDLLSGGQLAAPFRNLQADARDVADRIETVYPSTSGWSAIECLPVSFYRNQGCYLIGRIRFGDRVQPLVLALVHGPEGVEVDAVLLSESEVSVLFSFTRSYFHADVAAPAPVIAFLRSLMPRKPVAELYMALGYNKHGKTELYRDLLRHLGHSREQFEVASGDRGMVMLVFTMPSYDVVFKVIRDRFAYPKTATRQSVMARYQLVFRHDRAGRLVEAQEFEHLAFPRQLFTEPLLEELLSAAATTVRIRGESVTISHLYVERRVRPLNLHLREVDEERARAAVLDYGQAIVELAATNIFPGDLLLKNFGVTRHDRVVFYDYDELSLLTDCHFRDLPVPRDIEEEMAAEPWFFVGPEDVFPEEFLPFLGLPSALERVFTEQYGRLLQPRFWREIQARHEAGELIAFFPYSRARRLRPVD